MKKVYALLVALFVCLSLMSAQQKKITFSADRMSGTSGKKNGTTELEGNAKVQIDSLEITGDNIELFGKDFRYVSASGGVKGVDTDKGFNFSADFLTYDRDLELASFRGHAELIDSKNDVVTSAGMITYNQKTEIAFLQLDVKLKRKEITCNSIFATYRRTVSLLELSGSPLVIRDGDEFRADRITVNLETEYISLDGSVSGSLKETQKETPKETPKETLKSEGATTENPESNTSGAVPDKPGIIPAESGKVPAESGKVPAESGKILSGKDIQP